MTKTSDRGSLSDSNAPPSVQQQRSIEDLTSTFAEVTAPDEDLNVAFSWKTFWAYTGPGWLMSIAYLDPGNLESDLQAGAYTGYQLIWVLFAATAMGLVLQIMAARLGVVTGKHLAEICKQEYPGKASFALWIMTELAIIGSDIQEVVGSAIAFNILFGLPLWLGCLITGADTFTFLGLHYFGVRKLEALFAVLIGTMCVCFFVNFGEMNPSGIEIMKGFLPRLSSYATIPAVGLIGAVIMPHNLYLHSALVLSRNVDRTRPSKVAEANKYFAIEAAAALFVSFLINAAVVSVFAHGFFSPECAEQRLALVGDECTTIGLSGAGAALEDSLGSSAQTIWAIGLLAAGQSSTMCGTFAGQFVMEGFLDMKLSIWKRVALTRGIALIPAVLVALSTQEDSNASDILDQWLNILQSVQLPFALLPLMAFTQSSRLMGRFKNSGPLIVVTWFMAGMVLATNVYLIVDFVQNDPSSPHAAWFYALVLVLSVFYFGFVFYLVQRDIKKLVTWCRSKADLNDAQGHSESYPQAQSDAGPYTLVREEDADLLHN